MKPLFSNKGSYNATIKLNDKDKIIENDQSCRDIK